MFFYFLKGEATGPLKTLFCSLAFLSSCAFWEREKPTQSTVIGDIKECSAGSAPFVVSQITKSPNEKAITVISGADGLAESFVLNLRTCMKDWIRQDNPIQNAPFVVEYYSSVENQKKGQVEKVKVVSDTQGCIQWQERYRYKYTAQPFWIGLERSIKKEEGAYAGAELVPMAVNPWLSEKDIENGLPFILDTRCEYSRRHSIFNEPKNYKSKGLSYLEKVKKKERPLIWAPMVSLQIRETNPNQNQPREKPGTTNIRQFLKKYQKPCETDADPRFCYKRQAQMSLYIPLELRTLDMSQTLAHKELSGGEYDVEAHLLISPMANGKNYLLHEEICKKEGINLNRTNESLSLVCLIDLSYFNQNALYKLAIRIKPSKGLPFKKFEGVYSINLNFQHERNDFFIETAHDEEYRQILNTNQELNIVNSMEIQTVPKPLRKTHSWFWLTKKSDREEREVLNINEGSFEGVNFYPLHLDGHGEYKLSHIGGSAIGEDASCEERKNKENVVKRTVVFVGKICLTDVLDSQKKLNNESFRVFLERPTKDIEKNIKKDTEEKSIEEIYFNDEKQLFRADGSGCISIPIELRHNIYDRQRYFQVDVHILSESLNLYGKVRLALSPWQRAFQAFQDAQNLDENIIRFNTKGIDKPKLIINQFRSINLFPSYGLDKLLNIHLFHRIYLLFQPFIRRPDNLSLGLQHNARELLRDGHYLVRVLILRNPQETGSSEYFSRVKTTENLNSARNNRVRSGDIPLEGARYITHTDSVVKAKANFINFYMPIYLSTKQFYYIASRNLIVIEIHPADPHRFKYNEEDKNCFLNTEKTKWTPFIDHELENSPYVGAFNIQNLDNWNLLQPAKHIDTDQIINQSETGKKYRHFNFSTNGREENGREETQKTATLPKSLVENTGCVNELYSEEQAVAVQKALLDSNGSASSLIEPTKSEMASCVDLAEGSALSPLTEDYRKREEANQQFDVLKNFAQKESLRLITLSEGDNEGEKFLKDIQSSFESYLSQEGGELEDLETLNDLSFLEQFPKEDQQILKTKIEKICKAHFADFLGLQDRAKECQVSILTSYLKNIRDISEGRDPLISIFKIISDNELVSEDEALEQSFELCKSSQRESTACHTATREYVSQAVETAVKSFHKDRYFLGVAILSLLSYEEKQKFFKNIKKCSNYLFLSSEEEGYEKCYYQKLTEIYVKKPQLPSSIEVDEDMLKHFEKEDQKEAQYRKLIYCPLCSADGNSSLTSYWGERPVREKKVLKEIIEDPINISGFIEQGVKNSNRLDPGVLAFSKSLCLFWFDFYLKDYLKKEQMLSAYTKYIQNFDYLQILESDFDNFMSSYDEKGYILNDLMQWLNAEEEGGEATEEKDKLSGCYREYASCLVADHCLQRDTNKNKEEFCPEDPVASSSCHHLLEEECRKDSSFSLCKDKCLRNPYGKNCNGESLCVSKTRDFCLLNPDHEFCEKYDGACLQNYLPCLENNKHSPIFNTNNVLNYKSGKSFPPLKTCLENPYEFFNFENKMIVREISKNDPQWKSGFLRNFFVSSNASIGSYMNWTAQRGRSLSVSGKADIGAKFGSMGRGSRPLSFFDAGLNLSGSMSQSANSNESNSARRAYDARVGEGVYLTVGEAKITLGVTKFQKCLVIKPRPNAFSAKLSAGEPELYEDIWHEDLEQKTLKKLIVSRPGLILCNPTQKREKNNTEKITESYYYVSQQVEANNSQFLNLYDLANRPFMLILRGRREFVKMFYLLKLAIEGDNGEILQNSGLNQAPENMFINYPFPIEESLGLSLMMREFNETGFSPGVYHYPEDSDEYMDSWFAEIGRSQILLDPLTNNNIFSVPLIPENTVPQQNH